MSIKDLRKLNRNQQVYNDEVDKVIEEDSIKQEAQIESPPVENQDEAADEDDMALLSKLGFNENDDDQEGYVDSEPGPSEIDQMRATAELLK